MDGSSPGAVAQYLRDGGQILKVEATITVSERELLDYLANFGAHPKYHAGTMKPYVYNNTNYGLDGLVRIANQHRSAQNAPPFALRYDGMRR